MNLTLLEKKEFSIYLKQYSFSNQLRNKTFLITGASGMTGYGIIKWLLLENEIHNANITIYASTREPLKLHERLGNDRSVHCCLFGEEHITLENISIDYIVHCAAPTGRAYFVSHPVETFRVIIDATERLLELARNNNRCRFLYLSSMDIYGTIQSNSPITESYVSPIDSLNIRNAYPLGKKGAELLCRAYYQEYGVDMMIIRPASLQGLFQPYHEARIFNEILRCVLEKKDLILKTDGNGKKCFMYSLDAISAIFTVLMHGESGEVYNATNPKTFITLNELATHVFQKYSPGLRVKYDIQNGENIGFLPPFSFVQDNSKLEALGWIPLRDIDDIYAIDIERFSHGIK